MDWYEQMEANGDTDRQRGDCRNKCICFEYCNTQEHYDICRDKLKPEYSLSQMEVDFIMIYMKFSKEDKIKFNDMIEIFRNDVSIQRRPFLAKDLK